MEQNSICTVGPLFKEGKVTTAHGVSTLPPPSAWSPDIARSH